jgi:hypothetical protein
LVICRTRVVFLFAFSHNFLLLLLLGGGVRGAVNILLRGIITHVHAMGSALKKKKEDNEMKEALGPPFWL